jgi:rod shape-determining protein MreD
VLVKGNLKNQIMPGFLDMDLVIVLTAYILIRHGACGAAIFVFVQGILVDLFSAGILGLYTLIYLLAFLSINFGCRFFDLLSPRGQISLIALAVFLKQILFLAAMEAFSLEIILSASVFLSFALSAIVTGLIAPAIFYIFNHIEGVSTRGIQQGL